MEQSLIEKSLKKNITKISVFSTEKTNEGRPIIHGGIYQDSDDKDIMLYDTYKKKVKIIPRDKIASIAIDGELNKGDIIDDKH